MGSEQAEGRYESLQGILDAAMHQASSGKGHERHADNNRFEDQPIMQITRLVGTHPVAALVYQAVKKTVESGRLYEIKGPEAAECELLGAINYLAATIIRIREIRDSRIPLPDAQCNPECA